MKAELKKDKDKPEWLHLNKINEQETKDFEKYLESVMQNKKNIEQQIDHYYQYHLDNDDDCDKHDHHTEKENKIKRSSTRYSKISYMFNIGSE